MHENVDGRVRTELSFSNGRRTVEFDPVNARFQTAVVPIIFRRNGVAISTEATAFCLCAFDTGVAIFVTAAHVLDYVANSIDIDDSLDSDVDSIFERQMEGVEIFLCIPKGTTAEEDCRDLHAIPAQMSYVHVPFRDVALIIVDTHNTPVSGVELSAFPISLSPPVIGADTLALGFPQKPGAHNYMMTATQGNIQEVHPRRRDSSFITFPSFRTSGTYLHGMSGGPILNEQGYVVGVISTGVDVNDDDFPVGYGACIPLILDLSVGLTSSDGEKIKPSIADLIEEGLVRTDGHAVTVTRDDDGVEVDWHQ